MSFEGAKNIILTILVAASVFLTWNIWTYQPKLPKIQSDYLRVNSDQQKLTDVFKPEKILFHKGGKHFQTIDEKKVSSVQTEISKWKLVNFKDVSNLTSKARFASFVHHDGNTEVIFPDTVPLELYKSVLDIDNKKLPIMSFDRIVFSRENAKGNEGKVYFINYTNKKIVQSQVDAGQLRNFYRSIAVNAEQFPEYISTEISSGRMLFLPKTPLQLSPLKYFIDYMDVDKDFKNDLFNDPQSVKRETVSRGSEYTDGSSLLSVIKDSSVVEFVNPAQKSDLNGSPDNLLQKSFEFINNHAGWNNFYQYADMSEEERKVLFRLFINGYPVYNDQGMTEIKQEWGNEGIYRYEQPYFTLSFPLKSDDQSKVTLLSGKQVMELLTKLKNFNLEDLEDVRIGYKLTKDPSEPVIYLEPAWYYQYGGTWTVVPLYGPGGEKGGLE
jgi:regulatory protein YycH of two-component signal transduction system YycFG